MIAYFVCIIVKTPITKFYLLKVCFNGIWCINILVCSTILASI